MPRGRWAPPQQAHFTEQHSIYAYVEPYLLGAFPCPFLSAYDSL